MQVDPDQQNLARAPHRYIGPHNSGMKPQHARAPYVHCLLCASCMWRRTQPAILLGEVPNFARSGLGHSAKTLDVQAFFKTPEKSETGILILPWNQSDGIAVIRPFAVRDCERRVAISAVPFRLPPRLQLGALVLAVVLAVLATAVSSTATREQKLAVSTRCFS
jgi:hypothetical protein